MSRISKTRHTQTCHSSALLNSTCFLPLSFRRLAVMLYTVLLGLIFTRVLYALPSSSSLPLECSLIPSAISCIQVDYSPSGYCPSLLASVGYTQTVTVTNTVIDLSVTTTVVEATLTVPTTTVQFVPVQVFVNATVTSTNTCTPSVVNRRDVQKRHVQIRTSARKCCSKKPKTTKHVPEKRAKNCRKIKFSRSASTCEEKSTSSGSRLRSATPTTSLRNEPLYRPARAVEDLRHQPLQRTAMGPSILKTIPIRTPRARQAPSASGLSCQPR